MTEATLTQRALNRALLARQSLLDRSPLSLTEVMEQMGGMQTQYAPAGYIGLWSRMRDFTRPMLTQALEERRAVQATLMRVTIHTVSARDYWLMSAGVREARRAWFRAVTRGELGRIDMDPVAEAVRQELAGGPLRWSELTARMERRGFPRRVMLGAGLWVDLVRVPPSGTWERPRADLYFLADRWLPPAEVSEDAGMALLIRRYLGAFGPAPLRDIAGWMGVTVGRMRHVVDGMPLRPFRDERGKPLVDLPDAPLPDPETPAPVRFIAVWDATLLVHARRTGVLPEAYRSAIFGTKTPHSFNTFLLDGQVAGTWRFEAGEVRLSPLRELLPAERAALEDEAHRLSAFHS